MVRRVMCVGLIVLAGSALALGQKKEKKPIFPKLITQARYVMVTSFYGDQYSLRIPQEDRQAINDVQSALQKWGKYALVYKPENADLIFVVRKGRVAAVGGGATVSTGTPGTVGGPLWSADLGNPDDAMLIYDAKSPGEADKPAIWRLTEHGGLNAPDVPIIAKLRKQVEEAQKP